MPSPDSTLTRLWKRLLNPAEVTSASSGVPRMFSLHSLAEDGAERRLLRSRLQSVSLILLLASIAFVVKRITLDGLELRTRDIVQTFSLLLLFMGLMKYRGGSFLLLRTMEVIIFCGMAADFTWTLNDRLTRIAAEIQMASLEAHSSAYVIEFVAAIKDQLISMFGLLMIYGMFIPNTLFRSSVMVLIMALIPAGVIVMNRDTRATLSDFHRANQASMALLQNNNLLSLIVGAGVAIYGTSVVNRMKRRVQDAEELGQYRILRKLGTGGMGDVFLAEHRLLKRLCAVKLIRSDFADNPVMLSRFEREVRATAFLTHWNTIQVFDYGKTDDGRFFYVMEYLYGRNLLEVIRQFGPFQPDRTIFILRQVCEALRESSARGLVHRDIKPSNIFLSHLGNRFDVAKLLDFGLVRPVGSIGDPDISGQNQITGSPRYMCPEQAQGVTPDIRGDIYSLGAVAYYMLTGRPPFQSDNPLQLLIAHATQTPPSFMEIGVDVPADLSGVVMKCLQKAPGHRYSDPDELLAALNHWTWALAEHWWRTQMPECIGPVSSDSSSDVPGVSLTGVPADFGSQQLRSTATEATVITMSSRSQNHAHDEFSLEDETRSPPV
jgi:serine/threonine protein kinase